jgi:hypothetical protein
MRIKAYATLRDLLGAAVMDIPLDGATDVEYVLRRLVADCPPFGKKLWEERQADRLCHSFAEWPLRAVPVRDGDAGEGR